MQTPSIVQMLTPATPSVPEDLKPRGDKALFSKLLSDASHRDAKQPATKKTSSKPEADAPADTATQPAMDAASKEELRETKISPQQAEALIKQIDQHLANADGDGNEPFDQLKEKLEDIVEQGEPADVASILDGLPEQLQLHQPNEHAGSMQRMMRWLKDALQRQKDAAAAVAAVTGGADSTVQSLQAASFRPGVAENTAGQTASPTEKTDEITVIEPLAQELVIPEWARQIAAPEKGEAEQTATAVSGLSDDALPEVNLPGAEDVAKDLAPSAKKEKIALPDFAEQLQALPDKLDSDDAAQAPVTIHAPAAAQAHSSSNTGFVNTAHALAPNASAMPHVPISEQVHMAVTHLTKDGIDRITLQLDPADLGRVEIRMEMNDGTAKLAFLVDKPETLDHLSRDARSLERMLQEAGVKADAGTMQFSLRQQPQQFGGDGQGGSGGGSGSAHADDGEDQASAHAIGGVTSHHIINVREGVDIHA